MFTFVYAIYPYIMTDENMKSMDELMKVFPLEVLKYIKTKIDGFKNEDKILHALYSTPGESWLSVAVEKFQEM